MKTSNFISFEQIELKNGFWLVRYDVNKRVSIENVRKRMWTMCQATLTIDSIIGKGTKAVIKLPKGEENGNYSSR